jgi:hypothetical protein
MVLGKLTASERMPTGWWIVTERCFMAIEFHSHYGMHGANVDSQQSTANRLLFQCYTRELVQIEAVFPVLLCGRLKLEFPLAGHLEGDRGQGVLA